jgi:cathepsin L
MMPSPLFSSIVPRWSCGLLVGLGLLVAAPVTAQADESWQKLRKDGAEVYYADLDLRTAYAKRNKTALPETSRKTLRADARALDWTAILGKRHVFAQRDSICCWAFASVAAMQYNWVIRNGGDLPQLAVQPLLDRTGKDGSGYTGWALQDLLEHGTCLGKDYPLVGKPDKVRDGVEMPYRIIAWGMVSPPGGVPTPRQLKQALVDHGPLIVNVHVSPAFQRHKGGVFREAVAPRKDRPTSHILLLVGWDDKKGRAGAWKVQNSWGDAWCEEGFMWIEYGSNNIGHSACWLRTQATQYVLPRDVHKQVSRDTDSFRAWPGAKTVKATPPVLKVLPPASALGKLGERVTVRFIVLGGGVHDSLGHVELYSTRSWADPQCLIVRILKSELDRFPRKNANELLKSYLGKVIQVRGSVQRNPINVGNRPIIEVGDPGQIKVQR